jgi:putative tricarboxylic transport membrane protein
MSGRRVGTGKQGMEREGQEPRSSSTGTASPGEAEGGGVEGVGGADPSTTPKDDAPEVEVIERDTSPRALLGEIIPEIALLIGAIYLFLLAGRFEGQTDPGQLGPGFWPRMAATGLAIALVVRIVQAVRERKRPLVKVRSEFPEEEEIAVHWPRVGIAIGLAVGYVLASMFIGYLFATAAFLTAFIWIGGQRRWYVPLIAIAGALVSAYVFIGVVYVSLPTGVGIFDVVTVEIYRLLGIQ